MKITVKRLNRTMKEKEENLKPCPFCGGTDLELFDIPTENKTKRECISCLGCKIRFFADSRNKWNKRV